MRNSTCARRTLLSSLGLSALLGACGDFADDRERFNELDRLRVLAVRSEPADLVPGETATLSALVFEPKDRDVQYEWSWCPTALDESNDFQCGVREKDLRDAWASLDTDDELPRYDLGSDPQAQFQHLLTPALLPDLCAALSAGHDDPEQALLLCLVSLQPSVRLTVRTSNDEVVSIKTLHLLATEPEDAERNLNPEPSGDVVVRSLAKDRDLAPGADLDAGKRYGVRFQFEEAQSQRFTPVDVLGEQTDEPRRETLIMTWFSTLGDMFPVTGADFGHEEEVAGNNGGVEGIGDGERTTFVDGSNRFDALLRNGLSLPLTAGPEDITLIVVLRDERGGVGWATHTFGVKEAK